jgi:CheY-like chemotaxis protein
MSLSDRLWNGMADQSQIEQVLLNILINAWQAMPDGGTIHLASENVILDESFVGPFDITPGRYVKITVADTGIGMDKVIQRKIFEPFFTTKEIGRGTGLGLASAFGIMKNHDGAIDFHSRPGEGTNFYLYLPASDAVIQREPPEKQIRTNGSGTILLVDDEKVILDVTRPMIEALGYDVLIASSGSEALEIFQGNKAKISLVVLDMIMPDMGGGAVFDQLKRLDDGVKVLLSSGYSLAGQAEEIIARGCNGFIQKPFDLDQLRIKINAVIEG